MSEATWVVRLQIASVVLTMYKMPGLIFINQQKLLADREVNRSELSISANYSLYSAFGKYRKYLYK